MWRPIIIIFIKVESIVCNKSLQKTDNSSSEVCTNMGKISNGRRSRIANWSLEEKQFLLDLIKERKEIMVTKNNNGPSYSKEKDVVWNEILREMSYKFSCKFSGSSLKKVKTQWQNMKRIAREEITINGPEIANYTRQSREVCNILGMVKDGLLVKEDNISESLNISNVDIKTELIDENGSQPTRVCNESSNTLDVCMSHETSRDSKRILLETTSSSASSTSGRTYINNEEIIAQNDISIKKNASVMTDPCLVEDINNSSISFHKELQEFLKYKSTEKQLKMDSLKEERHVVRAMRETAELNKIIAEEKLKHVIWMKKREMAMYSGEPGSGAGKGGGGGGAIREAGGAFGKMEAAREDEYFYKKQKEQLNELKTHLNKEIAFHQEQIKRHEDAIKRHKEQVDSVDPK